MALPVGRIKIFTLFFTCDAVSVVSTDFDTFRPILFTNNADLHVFAFNDRITLEYDDKVLLRFTSSSSSSFITNLENAGEYIRDTATVNIIDSNCK